MGGCFFVTMVRYPCEEDRMYRSAIIVSYMALFALSLTVCLWGNDFPIAYNADEPGKVLQVTGEFKRNHRHPPLLLDTSWIVHKLSGRSNEIPQVVASGRLVSAIAATTTAVLLTALSHWVGGPLAAILVGLMVGLCPSLAVFAHYMKEDTLLTLGLIAIVVTATLHAVKNRWWTAALLGGACVIAVMAKYIGIIGLVPALYVLLTGLKTLGRKQRWQVLLAFVLALIASLALLGYHWWADWSAAISGVTYEWHHVRVGHFDLKYTMLGTLRFYLIDFAWELQYWPLLPGIVGMVWLSRSVKLKIRMAARVSLILCVCYCLLLILGHVAESRYALAAVVLISWFAAMCMAQWVGRLQTSPQCRRWRIVCCVLVASFFGYRAYQVMYQFTHDGRDAMGQWVQAHLGASDYLVEDMYCAMPDQHFPLQVKLYGKWAPKIRMKRYAADFGTVEQLRAKGVTHIAICSYSYQRFLDDDGKLPTSTKPEDLARLEHYRQFYRQLVESELPVWQHEPRYNLPGLTSPRLMIFRLP
jgi:4-amino-4-deoxy-L-arabinose transferase-like glycosyltransferase